MAARRKTKMTAQHKAALAEGRAQGRAVRDYLVALEQNKPKRGRKRTPDSVKKRLAAIETTLPDAAATKRLELVQERIDLTAELASMNVKTDLTQVERAFVKAAKGYGARKGISYGAWRAVGVSPEVLKKSGITRGA